jgi:hypothetical protein
MTREPHSSRTSSPLATGLSSLNRWADAKGRPPKYQCGFPEGDQVFAGLGTKQYQKALDFAVYSPYDRVEMERCGS